MAKLHPALMPYKPSETEPWDAVRAGHLMNRAGFGGTQAEIEKVVKMGPAAAVDWLLDFPDASADEQSQTDVPNLSSIEGLPSSFRELQEQLKGKSEEERKMLRQKFQQANREAVTATASWWLKRMVNGPYPLQEKLTLFWHGHFTTSAKDERSAMLIWNQNELLRRQAGANFTKFVKAVSRDPAMLDYLNNSQNRKQRPNENYARELMELFTLGIGNYTEKDIKEVARCFTGWAHDGEDFVFRKYDHDDGEKVVFGYKGKFGGDDVVDILMMHPVCAKYIATKLYSFFVTEIVEEDISKNLGEIFRDAKYDLRPLLRVIFSSKAFYDKKVIGSQIKSPVQLMVGTVRMLERDVPPMGQFMGTLNQMGQMPLYPPNVKGWPGGRTWISTSTLFVRYNAGVWLAGGANAVSVGGRNRQGKMRDANNLTYKPGSAGNVEQTVDYWVNRLVQRPIEDEKRKSLIDSMNGRTDENSVRQMIQLIVSMPDYQLC